VHLVGFIIKMIDISTGLHRRAKFPFQSPLKYLQKQSVQTFSKCHHYCRQDVLWCKKSFGRVRFVTPPPGLSESSPLLQILLLISILHIPVASVCPVLHDCQQDGSSTATELGDWIENYLCNGCRHALRLPHMCECGRRNKDVVHWSLKHTVREHWFDWCVSF
jgi:hypothetical protein